MATDTLPPPTMEGTPRATPSCPANVRETKIAFGYIPQSSLSTENLATEVWSMTKVNTALMTVQPNIETDAQDIGKGDEFPVNTYPVSMDNSISIEKYASSEFLAWTFCFATGSATKTPAGTGFTYAAVPSDPSVACIELTPFTYAEQIRAEPASVLDRAGVGMVINDFVLTMQSGPGRANCKMVTNCVGTGQVVTPSGLTFPPVTLEHFLNAASATINIQGIDYVLNKNFVSLEFRWNNNTRLPTGYFPGSGTQNGFAVRGRMEYNTRDFSLTFVARATQGSPEFLALMNQTPGPLTITLTGGLIGTGPSTHGASITAPRTILTSVTNADADGLVTVNCTVTFLKPTTGEIITMSATCEQDKILGL